MKRYSHFGDMTEDVDGEWIRYSDYVEAMNLAWNGGQSLQRALDNVEDMRRIAGNGVAPEGWKLVPMEPTKEMWDAVNKLDDQMAAGSYDGKGCSIEQAWYCMLASAPHPPGED